MTALNITRRLAAPTGLVIILVTGAAWFLTWKTSDPLMSIMMSPADLIGPLGFGLFFALITVMMVAMMLPAALPMIITFQAMTRTKGDEPTKSKGIIDTLAFISAYFLLWGGFGVAALLGLMALGLMGPLTGPLVLFPAATLVVAGAYQITRVKEACLHQCKSPLSFVMSHWRSGRVGAMWMGLSHATYCLGCCWLFMIALFVVGSMSLLWMGALSILIFAEKVGVKQRIFSIAIGAALLALGGLVGAQSLGII